MEAYKTMIYQSDMAVGQLLVGLWVAGYVLAVLWSVFKGKDQQ